MKKKLSPIFTFLIVLFSITIFQNLSAQSLRYVDSSITTSGNGTSWLTAYKTLSDAMKEASTNLAIKEIQIAKGTYFPTGAQNSSKRDSSFNVLRGDLRLIGGYSPGGSFRNSETNRTILSGDIGTPKNNNDNSYHVLVIAGLGENDLVLLEGLQILWGNASGSGSKNYNGINILNNIGGGVILLDNDGFKITFRNCIIAANRASDAGAGIYNRDSSPLFMNCVFSGNYANYGGAILNLGLFGTSTLACSPVFENCTIAGNHDNHNGGGMRNSTNANPSISNTIIYGNNGGLILELSGKISRNSLIQGITITTDGNLNGNTTNPLFIAPIAPGTVTDGGDYRLQSNSPCLNKGDNEEYKLYCLFHQVGNINTDKDLWGNKRLWDGTIDIGAHELIYTAGANGIVYVKKGNGGTGSSWANALPELGDALKAAKTDASIKEIWVAGGVYKPMFSPADANFGIDAGRDNAFLMVNNVKVYGGFAGTETNLAQRDLNITANQSTLSGDIDGDNTVSNNDSYHVMVSAGEVGTAILDGFNLSGGNANGSGKLIVNSFEIPKNQGAGFFNHSSSPVINKVTIRNNRASTGGGMFNEGTGGVPKITNSQFINNQSAGAGAGFYHNTPTELKIAYSTFSGNNAGSQGGGIFINNSGSTLELMNCQLSGNNATGNGGGIANWNGGKLRLYSSTVAANTSNGGSIYNNTNPATPTIIANSIIWGSINGLGGLGTPTVNNSIVKGYSGGTGNFNTDPQFSDPLNADFSLKQNSPAINKGNNSFFTGLIAGTKDLAGNSRVYNFPGLIDIGAYEYQGNSIALNIRYVDGSVTASGDGSSWATAYKKLSEAFDDATANSTNYQINIAKGTYVPTSGTDRNLSFSILKGGMKIYGGYPSGGGARNPAANPTILSGEIGAIATTDNSYHVMVIAGLPANADSVIIDGLNFQWGRAGGTTGTYDYNGQSIPRTSGGGIAMSGNANAQKIIITNCIISGNYASNTGAGVYIEATKPVFFNCLFSGNYANYGGAAFNFSGADTKYVNCTIAGNHDNNNGGGMRNSGADPVIINTLIYGNEGGISNQSGSTPNITFSLVQGLSATANGNMNGATNPQFVSAVIAGTVNINGDYQLKNTSPCINKGDNNSYNTSGGKINTDKDLWGNQRLIEGTIEMGANEIRYILPDVNNILYVKKGSIGNGSSWTYALGELADALKEASTNTAISQIWVAGGTYLPKYRADNLNGNDPNDRNNAFVLVKDVKVYGGFAGTELLLTKRNLNLTVNKSTLSGDLGIAVDNSDNSYHVIISSGDVGTSALDGFEIKNGNADAVDSKTIVQGLLIYNEFGGGIYSENSSPLLNNLSITTNSAIDGGGIYLYANFSTASNLTISENNASSYGGGIYITSGSPILKDVIVNGNVGFQGGGIYNSSSSPVMTNVTINSNTASGGAGIYNYQSLGTLTNVTISKNGANQGGAMFSSYSSPILTNVIISGNTANNYPGIANIQSSPILTNVTISGNKGPNSGVAVHNFNQASPIISNCIIYGNSGGIYNSNNSTPIISNSLVQGLSDITNGNISGSVDPKFIDMPSYNSAPFAGGDYHLNNGSAAINKGNNALYTGLDANTKDFAGNPRVYNYATDGVIDMGAYEFQGIFKEVVPSPSGIVYVKPGGTGNGNSWNDATSQVATALKAAAEYSDIKEIWVASGTYKPTYRADNMSGADPNDRDNAFVLVKDVKVYGGFAGTETDLANRDLSLTNNKTILSGDIDNNNILDDGNAYHVVVSAGDVGTALLDGFTIAGGKANGSSSINVNLSAVTRNQGGGIQVYNSSPLITRTIIENNSASTGGGVFNTGNSAPKISYSQFIGNQSTGAGAGFYHNTGTEIQISFSTFSGNNAGTQGGAIFMNNASGTLEMLNCQISDNTAGGNGGAIANWAGGKLRLYNATIASNTSNGGAVYSNVAPAISTIITNSIIWGNTNGIGGAGTPTITNSIVKGYIGGTGNLDMDPKFTNPASFDYNLKQTSPAINKGVNAAFPGLDVNTKDLGNNSRVYDFANSGIIDIGAFEYQGIPVIDIIPSSGGIVYVKPNASGNGSSWLMATDEVANALKAASTNPAITQIWVAGGTYLPKYRADNMNGNDPNDRNNAFLLVKDVKVYGGFAGTELLLTQRDLTIAANTSILSGNIGSTVDKTDNSFHVVISVDDVGTAELNGFQITDGYTKSVASSIYVFGKEVLDHWGGGIFMRNSSPFLNNLIISANHAYVGGGISTNFSSHPILSNVTITENNVDYGGGGIYNNNSSPIILNSKISGNSSNYCGAGIFNDQSTSPLLTNVIINGNIATQIGGGIYNNGSTPILTNLTISGNKAINGGGIYNYFSSPIIRNTIIYGNSTGIVNSDLNSLPVTTFSLVQGLSNTNDGNIDGMTNDPQFVNPAGYNTAPTTAGDYRLQITSPVINQGNNAYFAIGGVPDLSAIKSDLDGKTRIKKTIDLGAYEFGANVLSVELINYTAQAENNEVKLKWTTASETNNAAFILSRSADGNAFTEIGKVAGAGNSTTSKNYVYYDENPLSGINFYRLEQVDYDGQKTDLGVRAVTFNAVTIKMVKVYPNPVKYSIKVDFTANNYHQIELIDVNGQVLYRSLLSKIESEKKIDMSQLSAGVYFIKLFGNNNVETRKVIKD